MRFILATLALSVSVSAFARDVYVNGYQRANGTYVQPHMRSAPDGNPYNNYSTYGNTNPYTGRVGTHQPAPVFPGPPSHGSPRNGIYGQ